MMDHAYSTLQPRASWRTAIADAGGFDIADRLTPKLSFAASTRFAAGGGCLAQHIGREFKHRGLTCLDVEPAPDFMSADEAAAFGYGVHSARYGNISTSRQLLQLIQRAFFDAVPREGLWQTADGRWVDAFRPTIEKGGFGSPEEVLAMRETHLDAVRKLFLQTDVFIFALDLTETWENISDGFVYPMRPGTVGGEFDPQKYRLRDLTTSDVVADLDEFIRLTHKFNPDFRMVLTVSPALQTAVASVDHLVMATMQSTAVLHAAATAIAEKHEIVDYFPTHELFSSPDSLDESFEPDLKTARPEELAHRLGELISAHVQASPMTAALPQQPAPAVTQDMRHRDDVLCDYVILAQLGSSGG